MRSTGADRAGAARAIVLAAVLASLGRPGLVRADEAASSAALAQQLLHGLELLESLVHGRIPPQS